ncbi:MAG TPA: NAD(P)/FAD-dependent oxidoreductase [Candidatus Eisenbacteria bacterium]|jgi:thioredoxin reductase (NADPH)
MTRELVIVGAGPAGVSAALWARSLHLDVELLEAGPEPGGQLLWVHFHPREIPGLLEGDGRAIAAAYARQLAESGLPVRYGVRADALEPGEEPGLLLSDRSRIAARALLIASGARRRRLGVPGERELEGRGVSTSATRDRAALAGRAIVVVGGGDAAFENALLLVTAGSDVTLVARGTVRARPEFREALARERRARVLEHAQVVAVLGDARVRAVRLRDAAGERELACEGVVVKVGVEPNTEWCRDRLAHDAQGYLRVDERFATSAPGVWAAGDVVHPMLAGVPVAAGHGALAAAAIRAALRPA